MERMMANAPHGPMTDEDIIHVAKNVPWCNPCMTDPQAPDCEHWLAAFARALLRREGERLIAAATWDDYGKSLSVDDIRRMMGVSE